jgi:WD40 repeat protein
MSSLFTKQSIFLETFTISPDGYTLVSGGGDNLIKIWRVQD